MSACITISVSIRIVPEAVLQLPEELNVHQANIEIKVEQLLTFYTSFPPNV